MTDPITPEVVDEGEPRELAVVERPLPDQMSWAGASDRALVARQERNRIIREILIEGHDYGKIPGCGDKPALFKSGAEKIVDAFQLWPAFEVMPGTVEDWQAPLFHYRYRCVLMARGLGIEVSAGLGSCNSMESKYRWRKDSLKCPKCGAETIIKGKREYGGGWLCFAKKGGCGAKWPDGAAEIESQEQGLKPNDDIFSSVNAIDKMAQKRALVAAVLFLGFSEVFTQDIEDAPRETTAARAPGSPVATRGKNTPDSAPAPPEAATGLLGEYGEPLPGVPTESEEREVVLGRIKAALAAMIPGNSSLVRAGRQMIVERNFGVATWDELLALDVSALRDGLKKLQEEL